MGIFGFGKGSRGAGATPPPPSPGAGAQPSGDAPDDEHNDSFLTGDERTDGKNVRMLLAIVADVSSTMQLEKVLVSIVDKAMIVARSERGFLLLNDGDSDGENAGELTARVARDAAGKDLPKDTRFSTKVVSQVEETRKPMTSMVNSDARALELSQSVFDLRIRAVMCAPLLVKDKFMGAIYVDSRVVQREFTKPDLKFFAAFAAQAAVALENARLLHDSLEKERMEGELRVAQQIQKRMLPQSAPVLDAFEIHGAYEPASEATGDSFDFIQLPDGNIAFSVTDVSGHGLGPAFVTMSSRARLRAYLGTGMPLGDAITQLNRDLMTDVEEGMFQTLIVVLLDVKNGRLQYVNAGHPPGLLRRANGGAFVELASGGAALGLIDTEVYKPSEFIEFHPGDVIVGFTDGITEGRPDNGTELYGDARLRDVIAAHADATAANLVGEIVQSVKSFCGGKSPDDLTLVAMRRRPA
ncbi:MAG: SpoIIE family protein phosphatase [Planctomycetes bacterium]|nr:SpoIIE family protein phosphatase [Planctomycetota bacterium]